jgi:glutamine synthetase
MFELKTQKDVLKIVKEKNVSFIQFWFTDVLGVQKIFSITPSELQEGMEEGLRRLLHRGIL